VLVFGGASLYGGLLWVSTNVHDGHLRTSAEVYKQMRTWFCGVYMTLQLRQSGFDLSLGWETGFS